MQHIVENYAIMQFPAWSLPTYGNGERIDDRLVSHFYNGVSGYLAAGATVGGPLPSTGASPSSPVFYKRTLAPGGSVAEVDYTDGPVSGGSFIVDQNYSAANDCWTLTFGRQLTPHTSSCISETDATGGPYPGYLTSDISTNSASTTYKGKSTGVGFVTDKINHVGGSGSQFYPWDYPYGGTTPVGLAGAFPASPGCGVVNSTTQGSFSLGIGTGVTC
jgi:hypothetical protein